MKRKDDRRLTAWIETSIREFVRSPQNSLQNESNDPAWGDPLVGFSRGDDPLYGQLKAMIGDFYWTPNTIFDLTFPQEPADAKELSVISWVLPQTETTKADNRKEATVGCERWVRARKFGEIFNVALRAHVVEMLRNEGYQAVAPGSSPLFGVRMSDAYGMCTNWSERHAAYVSGLGTFGLCDGLITKVGKAIRCGSVVARISVSDAPRPYKTHHAYCLFYAKGTCGACIKRCPAGALSEKGHDKKKCLAYLEGPILGHAESAYGLYGPDAYGCGLCQTKVPCESRIPVIPDA
jgi:epoxyqueuosine reductase